MNYEKTEKRNEKRPFSVFNFCAVNGRFPFFVNGFRNPTYLSVCLHTFFISKIQVRGFYINIHMIYFLCILVPKSWKKFEKNSITGLLAANELQFLFKYINTTLRFTTVLSKNVKHYMTLYTIGKLFKWTIWKL